MSAPAIRTLGELRASGYRPRSLREELRQNLLHRLRAGTPLFRGDPGSYKMVDYLNGRRRKRS